jgi:hypothetical protein
MKYQNYETRTAPNEKYVRGLTTENFETFSDENRGLQEYICKFSANLIEYSSRCDFSKSGDFLLFLMWQHWIS